MKKFLSLILAAMLTAGAAAALGSCGKNSSALDWYVDVSFTVNEDSKVSRAIRSKTGLEFSMDSSSGTTTDKLSLMISSSSLPDLISMRADDERYRQLAASGNLWSLEELNEKYHLGLTIEDEIKNHYAVNGATYGLPSHFYLSDENEVLQPNGAMLVRKDYFESYMEYVIDNHLTDNAAYDITTAAGATNAMRWVYHNCVPENKKSSYFGLLLDPFVPSTSFQGVAWLCQYFGVRYEDMNGNYVDGAQTEQFKEVLDFLNTLYNNDKTNSGEPKMLPQAALGNTEISQVGEVLARGDAFIFCGTPQNYPSYLAAGRFPQNEEDEPVEYVSMVIKNSKGEDPQLGDIAGAGYLITAISKSCKNPETAAKALAYLWSDEGQELCAYGLKGVADESGTITGLADESLAAEFTAEDATYFIDANGQYHYTDNYISVLGSGDEEKAAEYGVAEWTLLNRPTYLQSRNWGIQKTNKESEYIDNIKMPLAMYSTSYTAVYGLLDPLYDYKADASVGKSYSEIVGIKAKVDARWANAVTKIIATENKEASFRILDNAINALKGLGYDTLYAAYNVKFKEKKQTLGVPLVYPLNRSDYTKKTISEGGRYTWEKNGKTYSDVWGARGDINYYKKYIIV